MAWRVPPKTRPLALRPGVYLAEIAACQERASKKTGDAYLNVKLIAVEWGGEELCWDTVMLEGNGEGVGRAKLGALGIDVDDGAEHADGELIGKRVYVAAVVDVWRGTERLRVDGRAHTSHAGYWPEAEAPSGVKRPEPLAPPPVDAGLPDDFIGPDGKPMF